MKRLYYLFSGTDQAKNISRDLQSAGISYGQLHFMAKNNLSLNQANLHTTSLLEERDLQHKGAYGSIIGLGSGLLVAFYLLAVEFQGQLNMSLFFGICIIFTCFGAWAGGMLGISSENFHLARFHDALEDGDTLLMLDTYSEREESKAKALMHHQHLEAKYEGEDENVRLIF